MKVLKVIHGFPPDYMAGSEVYSYNLVKELQKYADVFVFTRVENDFDEEYKIYDEQFENIKIRRINNPKKDYTLFDKYFNKNIEQQFRKYITEINPDIIHIGHLSHLSVNIIKIAKEEFKLPVVFTIHDFWMYCVKGQLLNYKNEICSEQTPEKCQNCINYQSTLTEISFYQEYLKKLINMVDIFISPSYFLKDFYINNGVDSTKIIYSKYGFNKNLITYKDKKFNKSDTIKFGFIGRIIPSKGIKLLIDVFNELQNCEIDIYGFIGNKKRFLEVSENIKFKGGYDNNNINDILSNFDVLIAPSIWYENAPLVIQEAFIAGIPVITSNIGGMKELVNNNINGFTFDVNNKKDLKRIINEIINNPLILNNLNLKENVDIVVSIEDEVKEIFKIYKDLLDDNME